MVYKRWKNIRAVQRFSVESHLESIIRYFSIKVADAIDMVQQPGTAPDLIIANRIKKLVSFIGQPLWLPFEAIQPTETDTG
ncbi:hypothetical protein ASF66_20885 [Pseudomonas sp. Leaf129]|nr:hypothetical protein ASF66_20885 [Pseudomonas sp. Leaf129]